MRIFWICLIAALSSIGLGQRQPRQFDIHVLLQRPGQADAKPVLKVLEDREAAIQWGLPPADSVSLKFKANQNRDRKAFGLLFTLGQADGSFTAVMPSGEFSLDFAKNAKGMTVVHMVQADKRGYTLAAMGKDWDRFVGWRLTVDAAAVPMIVEEP